MAVVRLGATETPAVPANGVNPVRKGSSFANGTVDGKNAVIKLYQKILEISLISNNKDYNLDKYQSLNGKPLKRILIPNYFQASGTIINYGTAVQTQSGKTLITDLAAIDGAYFSLINQQNQKVLDGTPCMFFKNDQSFFWDKMEFKDTPYIDWTQSKIYYPSTNIPNAQNGNAWQIVVEYYDFVYEDQLTFSTA